MANSIDLNKSLNCFLLITERFLSVNKKIKMKKQIKLLLLISIATLIFSIGLVATAERPSTQDEYLECENNNYQDDFCVQFLHKVEVVNIPTVPVHYGLTLEEMKECERNGNLDNFCKLKK